MKFTIVAAALSITALAQDSSSNTELTSVLKELPNCALICITNQIGGFDISLLSTKLCENVSTFTQTFSQCTKTKCTSPQLQNLADSFVSSGKYYCDAAKKISDKVAAVLSKPTKTAKLTGVKTVTAGATKTGNAMKDESQNVTSVNASQAAAPAGKLAIPATSTKSSASTAIWTLGYTSMLMLFI
ncbi:hypothetical protein HDU79_003970 [Rhizoclosmatium sp. JEL0117]|nr:hypothetical protein HDU79_003970 [Rhizoclosmatium sp. JEL0117]